MKRWKDRGKRPQNFCAKQNRRAAKDTLPLFPIDQEQEAALKRLLALRATDPPAPPKKKRSLETARSIHGRTIGGFPPPEKKWD